MNVVDKIKSEFRNFWNAIYVRWFQRSPGPKTIDKTGMLFSDHPVAGQGWIKGWVVDTPNRNIAIVTRHAGPGISPPHDLVYAINKFGKKVERKIVAVERPNFAVGTDEASSSDRVWGDIAVIRVDIPFPDTVTAYRFANHVKENPNSVTPTPRGYSKARILMGKLPWIKGRRRSIPFIAGDSGLPWFVWEHGKWRVATHTCKGMWGEGPWYTHPDIYDELRHVIARLQS